MTRTIDSTWFCDIEDVLDVPSAEELDWDESADVVVVGAGGAGICAALEARAAGADVLILDRFEGGGATARSGGVIYLGGGTEYQHANNIDDDPERMFRYLQLETGGVVEKATLRAFCDESVATLQWLEAQGVEFNPALFPDPTSYPDRRSYLYYSGNETVPEYARAVTPAPRGHRVFGRGGAGRALFGPLWRSARAAGVRTRIQSRVRRLVRDADGRVIGVETSEFGDSRRARWYAWCHRLCQRGEAYLPRFADRCRVLAQALERHYATGRRRIRARRGVVLASGGFVMNRPMLEHYAPDYQAVSHLGDSGCDGSGIALGQSVGGTLGSMDRVSVWRCINPPPAWAGGVMVNNRGERFCNEQLDAATLGRQIAAQPGGRAMLILDRALFRESLRQLCSGGMWLFQAAPALLNVCLGVRRASTVEELAHKVGVSEVALADTVAAYNRVCSGNSDAAELSGDSPGGARERPHGPEGRDDREGRQEKTREPLRGLHQGPYYALDLSLESRFSPCPGMTLGGLRVDPETGAVLDHHAAPLPGLYAAGRCAVGVASASTIGGLSLADCIITGRRAGRAAAGSLPRG